MITKETGNRRQEEAGGFASSFTDPVVRV